MGNLKHYSKKSKSIFYGLNIVLLVLSSGLFIAYTYIKGTSGLSAARNVGIIFICLVSLFFILNLIKIFLEYSKKTSINKNIVKLVEEKKYLEAKAFLEKKHQGTNFYSNYQMILYYYGYLEISLDNLDDAKSIFNKIDISEINYGNFRIISSTIFLLGMIYQYEKDIVMTSVIIKTINDKKDKIISFTKNDAAKNKILNIILDLNSDDMSKGIDNLKTCIFKDMPFIQRFIINIKNT